MQIANAQALRTTFAYDAAGRRTVKKIANAARTSFSFDNANRLTRLVNIKSSGVTISSFGYQYDKTTRRTGVIEASGDRVTWTYDPTYQLTHEQRSGVHSYNVTYTYDPIGNRTLKNDSGALTTSTYDVANRLKYAQDSTGRTTCTFDSTGNQTKQVSPTLAITTSVWDFENMNTVVVLPSSGRVTSVYNGDKLRVEKDTASSAAKFVYDGKNILSETDVTNLTQAVYTLEPKEFGNLISQRQLQLGTWVQIYYAFDALGSTDSLTDASAVITDTYTYFAFGVIKVSTGTTTNRFTWVGELLYVWDPETGEFHLLARPYGPIPGRMKNDDPVGRVPDANQQRYVGNDPINFTDPSGMEETDTSPLLPAGLNELPSESIFAGVTGWPKAPRNTSNTATAKTRKKIREIIGDWEKEKSYTRAAVDSLLKKGLATEHVSMKTYDGGTVIRKYVAIPRDDGSVDTLTLKSVWPLFWGKYHYELESYKHGVTPKVLEDAREARDWQDHLNYMTVHTGIIKIQTGLFSTLGGPVSLFFGTDAALAGVRDIATLEENPTYTTDVIAHQAEKIPGVDKDTARNIGEGANLILIMFGDAAFGTSWEGAGTYRLRIVNDPPPEFLSGGSQKISLSIPERIVQGGGVVRSTGPLKNRMGNLDEASRQARTDPVYGIRDTAPGNGTPQENAGARGVPVHQEVVGEYVAKGGTDLGFTHKTTDVSIGGPGTPKVSIVTVDLSAPSYNKVVAPNNKHPLTSALLRKAWRSSIDPKAGPGPRIVHAELYGPGPTSAQQAAIDAAVEAAARFKPPVEIIIRHRP